MIHSHGKAAAGMVLIALSALCYSLLPIFALYAYRSGISVSTLLAVRFAGAGALLFLYAFARKTVQIPECRSLAVLFVMGAVLMTLLAQCYLWAVKFIPAGLAALLLYTYPILVTLISAGVNRERISARTVASIGLSFGGLVLILGTSFKTLNGIGVLLGLGAAAAYSIYIVIGGRVGRDIEPVTLSAFISVFTLIGVLGTGLVVGDLNLRFDETVWIPVAGMILISTFVPMILFFKGLERVGPSRTAVISMAEPVFTALFSCLLFSDPLTGMHVTGGALVLAGSLLTTVSRQE